MMKLLLFLLFGKVSATARLHAQLKRCKSIEEDFIELTATKFDYKQQYETDEIVFENTFKKLQTIK